MSAGTISSPCERHSSAIASASARVLVAVVDDVVGDAGAVPPADEIALAHRRDMAVVPGIDLAGRDIDVFVLVALRMRPARAAPGFQNLHPHADARKLPTIVEPRV